MKRECITDRIDCALEKMRARGMQVRAIYLTDVDRKELDRWATRRWRETGSKASAYALSFKDHPIVSRKLAVEHFRDHEVRDGATSRVYSTHGVNVCVPARLSPRTKARAA